MNLHFCHVLVCFCQLHSRRDVVFKRRPHEPYGRQLGAKRDKTKIWLRKSYYIKRHNNSHLDASVKQVGWQKLPRSPLGAQEHPGGGGGFGENGNHSLTCLEGPLQYRDSVAWVWCRLIQCCSRRTNWLNLTNTVKDGQAFNKMSKNWDFLGHKKDPKMLTEIIITFYLSKIVFVYLYQKLWNSIIHKIFCRRATTNLVWFRPTHQFQLAPWKKKSLATYLTHQGKKHKIKITCTIFSTSLEEQPDIHFFLQPLFLGWEWLVLNCSGMDQTT